MTIFTTEVISSGTIFDFDTEGTNLIVTSNGGVYGTGGVDVVTGTESYSYVNVSGEIVSSSGNAVDLSGDHASVTIGESGSLLSTAVAMNLSGEGFLVNNAGAISGRWGITAYGGSGTINNSGRLLEHPQVITIITRPVYT